jgi:formylglycine-generating enzyme required for sulfatase activity
MLELDWVEIPAGKFQSGLYSNQLTRIRNELGETFSRVLSLDLVHYNMAHRTIELPTFYMARFPITHVQMDTFFTCYAELNSKRVRHSPDVLPNFPEEASWYIADLFSHWVGGRLPTAAEWEKAARGSKGWLYPWSNKWDPSRGNFTGSPGQPGYPAIARDIIWTAKTPVDGYPTGASPYEVWDMVGNVAEWTMTVKPIPNTHQEGFVVKGNSAKDPVEPLWYYHITARERVVSALDVPFYIGFRPVKDVWGRNLWQGFSTVINQ